ncbi:MAG: hypothetical protein R2939_18575 [Kofleriaceae bacterium]
MRARARAMLVGLVAATAGAGCDDPPTPLQIRYELTDSATQRCPSTSCADIEISCDAVLQIRVVDPDDPTQAYVSACLPVDRPRTLCEISRDDLPAGLEVPTGRVEIQIAVYPRSAATVDDEGVLHCPSNPRFGADGFPVLVDPGPALGGRAFTEGGDGQVVVELGCTDLGQLADDSCSPIDSTEVSVGVTDLDTRVVVDPATAATLSVSTGEPTARLDPITQQLRYSLDPASAFPLPQTTIAPVPAWQGEIDTLFDTHACAQVLEDTPQATTAIACRRIEAGAPQVALTGYRVARSTVDDVLDALGLASFPSTGLVLGMVVTHLGIPASGVAITASSGTVRFLDASGTALTAGTTTTSSGMFVSLDAPFLASWSVGGPVPPVAAPIGGLINGKVSVVFVQLDLPVKD